MLRLVERERLGREPDMAMGYGDSQGVHSCLCSVYLRGQSDMMLKMEESVPVVDASE
jgi:hypothetical protein